MNNQPIIPTRILAAALILALLSAACSFSVNLPVNKIETGPTQTVDIQVPLPAVSSVTAELNLEFVAGDLKLNPGASGYLVSGTATFNAPDVKPVVETSGSTSTIRTGEMEITGVPFSSDKVKNEWDLQLADVPMSLKINAGAYQGGFDLGGLSLANLDINEGGSDLTLSFSAPNKVQMSSLTYKSGGSKTKLQGLANANAAQMTFKTGAGQTTLSFDGTLQRDASVTVDSGAGTVNIIVPVGVNAKVIFTGGLSSVTTNGGWVQNGKEYTLSGSGPALTITVKMGAGTLNLDTQ